MVVVVYGERELDKQLVLTTAGPRPKALVSAHIVETAPSTLDAHQAALPNWGPILAKIPKTNYDTNIISKQFIIIIYYNTRKPLADQRKQIRQRGDWRLPDEQRKTR